MGPGSERDADDADREVSRRVDNPTTADPNDEAAYRAADPAPDDEPTDADPGAPTDGTAGAAERASDEMQGTGESEPTRSE